MALDREQLALVVHDLKNPLAALLSNLGFVLSAVRSDEMTSEAVQDCLLSTEVLSRLIENMAVVGQFDERPGVLDGTIDLSGALESVSRRMEPHIVTSGFQWQLDCPPSLPPVQGSERLFELVVDNLISVSMAYAPTGSTIRVIARQEGTGAVVTVADDGPPVSDQLRPLAFARDGQGMSKKEAGGRYGRGLGLFVVGLIVPRCGGRLELATCDSHYCCHIHLVAPGS